MTSAGAAPARTIVGTSGWAYRHWRRGAFYPAGLRQRDELAYLASRLPSIELNGTFYALQRPASFQAWRAATPDDFLFAVKGGRFITHNKKLRDAEAPLANFFASGLLALGDKLGPIVWQLPEQLRFDEARMTGFLQQLPRDTRAAARLARRHDDRLAWDPWLKTDARRPIRHALEPRHPSFVSDACLDLLRAHDVALVIADSGRWPRFEEITASFLYLRLHGSPHTYASRYEDEALDEWVRRIRAWRRARPLPRGAVRDVYVYFDNDGHAYAPHDAERLLQRLEHRRRRRLARTTS